jgi:RHS repeat-associated protein
MATTTQLSENSHQGFDGIKAALCLASMEVNSNTASELPLRLRSNGIRSRCTGKERDNETGLDYFGARYYSGAQGRFISPDEFKGGIVDPTTGVQVGLPGPLPYADILDPQTLNKYGYVRNNPLRYIDPDGHSLEDILDNANEIDSILMMTMVSLGVDTIGTIVSGLWGGTNQPNLEKQNVEIDYKKGVPNAQGELKQLVGCIGSCMGENLLVTSTSEHVSGTHGPNTPHGRGEAADFRANSVKKADHMVQCADQCGAGAALNEVRHPSAKASGPHVHVQTKPGKGGWRGDLPGHLKKKKELLPPDHYSD